MWYNNTTVYNVAVCSSGLAGQGVCVIVLHGQQSSQLHVLCLFLFPSVTLVVQEDAGTIVVVAPPGAAVVTTTQGVTQSPVPGAAWVEESTPGRGKEGVVPQKRARRDNDARTMMVC